MKPLKQIEVFLSRQAKGNRPKLLIIQSTVLKGEESR